MMPQTTIEEVETHHAHAGRYGIATIAGTPYDPSGDGGPATLAAISLVGVVFRDGNLYLTDGPRIRKIAADGSITTVVGLLDPVVHQPIPGFSGDGGPALGAQLRAAFGLEFDSAGNLFITDSGNSCVRKITARVVGGVAQPIDGTEIITTIAGIGATVGNTGDGGPATAAKLNGPRGIAIDPGTGALYIADGANNNIRKIDAAGTITTIGGTGATGFADGPAASSLFDLPTGVTVDPATGDVYVGDVLNSRVRKISGGNVTTFAGTGTSSSFGNLNEGGQALAANVHPIRVRFVNGLLYFVDSGVGMIRQIDVATGFITTLVGSGLPAYTGSFPPLGDGGPARAGLLGSGASGVQDSAFDDSGNLFITDASSRRVRFVASASAPATIFGQMVAAGNIATVAGPPAIVTFSGDGGAAASARLFPGNGAAVDPGGNLCISDTGNNRVRQITPEGNSSPRIINTVAGSGTAGFSGVPGPATSAQLQPGSLAFHGENLYLTNNSSRVLEITGGLITLIANTTGTSLPIAVDGTPAVQAHLSAFSVAFDQAGNLYVGDGFNFRIWKIDTSGNIASIVGNGTVVIDGVTIPSATATQVRLFGPGSLALDPRGNLYTTDGSRDRILKITAHAPGQVLDGTETVTIFAGTGKLGFAGDGGPANAALLNGPMGLMCDAAGKLYFTDGANFRVRRIDTNGMITTIAGTGTASFSGDGGPALGAQIRGGPLALDSFGNIFLVDGVNNVVRVLDDIPPAVVFGTSVPPPNAHGWHNSPVSIPFTATDSGAGMASTTPSSPLVLTEDGFSVSGVVTAADRAGNSARFISHAVKIDKKGPVIAGMPKTEITLLPDGRMVHVATVTASDDLSGVDHGSFHVTGTSNEPTNPGEISILENGSGGFEIRLAARRSEGGQGRTYTLTAKASDYAGNASIISATVVVPRH